MASCLLFLLAGAMTFNWLLTAEEIRVHTFNRADAHVALRPYLSKIVLPEGAANLALNRPSRNVVLLAPKASLVVRKDMHPALQYALLDAAYRVHAIPTIFHIYEEFPSDDVVDLPLSVPADSYYKSGSPFLQRYMPFWVAVLVSQLLLVLLPIIGVAYPLLRVLPALYEWGMRRRIYNLYGELKFLEAALEAPADQVLRELLSYDLVGFQTARDRRNFVNCLRTLDVYGNVARNNTGGILAFITPGLPIKTTYDVIIRNNWVSNNNTPNFGAPGSTVGGGGTSGPRRHRPGDLQSLY